MTYNIIYLTSQESRIISACESYTVIVYIFHISLKRQELPPLHIVCLCSCPCPCLFHCQEAEVKVKPLNESNVIPFSSRLQGWWLIVLPCGVSVLSTPHPYVYRLLLFDVELNLCKCYVELYKYYFMFK